MSQALESPCGDHYIISYYYYSAQPAGTTATLCRRPPLSARLQVREEAGELCQTLEHNEGTERAASEAADLLYHALVLLNLQARAFPSNQP